MVIKNNNNVYVASQDSATVQYLVYGIIGILLAIAFEFAIIWNFFQSPLNEAIGLAVMLHIFIPWILAVLIQFIPAYNRKTKFTMYFAYIEDADMKSIKHNYYVCNFDETCVLFIDDNKHDIRAYHDWVLMHRVDNLATVKDEIFSESEAMTTA